MSIRATLRTASLRAAPALLAFALAAISISPADQTPPDYFTLASGAELVVTVTVESRREDPTSGFIVYDATVGEVLAGNVTITAITVAQELIFPSEQPWFGPGDRRVLALEALPSSTRYQELRQAGIPYRVRAGTHGARRAEAALFVQRYLAAGRELPAARAQARISTLVAALSSDELGNDAVRALDADPALTHDTTGEHAEVVAAALGNRALPLERRRALLDTIEKKRLAALVAAVESLRDEPEMAPFARRVLASFGTAPSADEVRADLRYSDPAARRAALSAAQALRESERWPLLADVAATDGDFEVRAAAIDGLARGGTQAVPFIASLLEDGDSRVAYKAARGLVAAGGASAVAALSATFAGDNYEAQVAAVFALRDIGSEDAMHALRALRDTPPDPRLEKVLDVALGDAGHHH